MFLMKKKFFTYKLCIMKKYVMFILAFTVSVLSVAKVGDQLTLEAGSTNVIWNLQSAFFELDFSSAIVKENNLPWDQWLQMKGNDFLSDWQKDKSGLEIDWITSFNKKTNKQKGLKLQNSNPDERYRMIIHVDKFDVGSIGGGISALIGPFIKKSGGSVIYDGYIDVVDQTQKVIVCRLRMKDVRGNLSTKWTSQISSALLEINDELFGFDKRFGEQQLPEIPYTIPNNQPKKVLTPATNVNNNQGQATVKLKNGVTVSGVLKSFDPLTNIVLIIAGQETTIPMSQVENVETKD